MPAGRRPLAPPVEASILAGSTATSPVSSGPVTGAPQGPSLSVALARILPESDHATGPDRRERLPTACSDEHVARLVTVASGGGVE